MTLSITPIYAGVLALLFVFLSLRVIGARRRSGVALGDGGNRVLMRSLRAHGNFAEYVPLALVLMALAEWQGVSGWALHVTGLALLAGRTIHAIGLSREPERFALRTTGMALTITALILGALANLGLAGFAAVGGL